VMQVEGVQPRSYSNLLLAAASRMLGNNRKTSPRRIVRDDQPAPGNRDPGQSALFQGPLRGHVFRCPIGLDKRSLQLQGASLGDGIRYPDLNAGNMNNRIAVKLERI